MASGGGKYNTMASDLDDILDSLQSLQLDINNSLDKNSQKTNSEKTMGSTISHKDTRLAATKNSHTSSHTDDDEFPLPPPPEELLWYPTSSESLPHPGEPTSDHLDGRGADSCEVMSTDSGIQDQDSPPPNARRKKLAWVDDSTPLPPPPLEESSQPSCVKLSLLNKTPLHAKSVSQNKHQVNEKKAASTGKLCPVAEPNCDKVTDQDDKEGTDVGAEEELKASANNLRNEPQTLDKYQPRCQSSKGDQISEPPGESRQENAVSTTHQEPANDHVNDNHIPQTNPNPKKKETKEEKRAREKLEKQQIKEREKQEKLQKKLLKEKSKQPTPTSNVTPNSSSPKTNQSCSESVITDRPDFDLTQTETSLISVTLPDQQNTSANQKQKPEKEEKQADFCEASIQKRIQLMNEIFNKSNLKKMAVRMNNLDKTTKMLLVDERMKAGHVCNLMANKNMTERSLNHAIVEKLPDMKMERIIEDHELLADTLLAWPDNSKNLLFFEERIDKFGAITNANEYLGGQYHQEAGESPSQQQTRIIIDLFDGFGAVPPLKEVLYVRVAGSKSWKKMLCTVRSSGIYTTKDKKGTTQDLVCITPLADQFLYTTLGGWTKSKIDSPTPYGFALKGLQTQNLASKQIYFFAALTEKSMKIWCNVIRIAKNNTQYYLSYQQAHKTASLS